MKSLGALLAALAIPLALLNMFGGIVGGVWLAILGEWSVIFLGIGILFVGAFAVSLLLMPGMGLAVVGALALERGNNALGWLFLILASPWTVLVIMAWEVGVFIFFGRRVTPDNVIPLWLWTYGAATGVWSFLASKEQQGDDRDAAAVQAFAAQVAFIVLSVCQIWLGWPLVNSVIAMAIPLILPLAFGIFAIAASQRHA